jgi:enoyl-CoA hydratase/carnithine racemase
MADYNTIKVDISEGILTLTLNRPDKMNAFTGEMMLEMVSAFDLADADDSVRAVIVTGAGDRAFCAGADLSERLQMSPAEISEALASLRRLMDGLASIPVPTSAVIEGGAFGGGLELALACDEILLVDDGASTVSLPEVPLLGVVENMAYYDVNGTRLHPFGEGGGKRKHRRVCQPPRQASLP